MGTRALARPAGLPNFLRRLPGETARPGIASWYRGWERRHALQWSVSCCLALGLNTSTALRSGEYTPHRAKDEGPIMPMQVSHFDPPGVI